MKGEKQGLIQENPNTTPISKPQTNADTQTQPAPQKPVYTARDYSLSVTANSPQVRQPAFY